MKEADLKANLKVRFVNSDLLRPLRHTVLRVGMPYESTLYEGDDEFDAAHAAVFDGEEKIIAIGTIMCRRYENQPDVVAFQLRGMAVAQENQGRGAGKIALDALEEKARDSKAKIIWCKARTAAAGFYERNGWSKDSEEFELPEFGPHFLMVKAL